MVAHVPRAVAAALLFPANAAACMLAGPIPATVERVVDGDTIRMRATIWIDQAIEVSVRLAGVDAPELFRPKCAAERAKAVAAKAFVEDFLASGAANLSDVRHDKYAGRVIARVDASGVDLSAALLAAGLAASHDDFEWCLTG